MVIECPTCTGHDAACPRCLGAGSLIVADAPIGTMRAFTTNAIDVLDRFLAAARSSIAVMDPGHPCGDAASINAARHVAKTWPDLAKAIDDLIAGITETADDYVGTRDRTDRIYTRTIVQDAAVHLQFEDVAAIKEYAREVI